MSKLIATLAITLAYLQANATTIILADKPANIIKSGDAMKSKTPVYECVKKHAGPRINPVKVAGSNSLWSSNPGTGIENAGELSSSGKSFYECKSKLFSNTTARMKSADATVE